MLRIWTYINLRCHLWYNYARMYIFLCITCCMVPILICAVIASAAVPHPAVIAKHVVHKLSFASRFTYLTQYAAPHRSMDVGGALSLSLKCESWLLMPIWEFNSLFTHLGGGSTLMAQKISIIFHIFCKLQLYCHQSQKWGNWKCNQALIVGFDDNDHAIRGLMRFIEMISREYIIEDVIQNGGASNCKCQWFQTQRRFKCFYILNLGIEKAVL